MPRPRLHPTDEQRKLVKFLAAIGMYQYQIAAMIGIRSPKTLRKYFRAEIDHGDLEGYAKVKQVHFQMATDGKHWPATKAWQDSYVRRHGEGPDQGVPVSPSNKDKSHGAEKRQVSRIVWRAAEQPKPPAPPEPAKLASPQPVEPAPVPSDDLASDEPETQQTEAERSIFITLQAESTNESSEEQTVRYTLPERR
jgi:hypothetical protein